MADKALVYRINFEGLDKQIDAIGKVDRELANLGATIKKDRAELESLEKTNQKNTQRYADLTNELGKNIVQQRNLTKEKGDLIRETQNEAKVNQENEGSITSLRAQLSNLTKEYNNLTKAERESAKGKDVQNQAKAISDELKKLEGAIGDNRRNVGNYADALKGLSSQFTVAGVNVGGLIDKFQNFRNTAQGIVDALGNTDSALKGNAQSLDTFNNSAGKSPTILSKVVGGLRTLRISMLAIPLIAIISALGTLVGAFLSTQEGIDAVTRIFKPFQVAFQRIIGLFQEAGTKVFTQPKEALKDLGDFIVGQFTNRLDALRNIFNSTISAAKNLGSAFTSAITGDFDGARAALNSAGDDIKNVGSNFVDFQTGVKGTITSLTNFAAEALKTGKELADLGIKIEQVENRNKTLIASLNAQIEAEKALAADTSKTAAEREAAGKKAIELIEQRKQAELELIELQIKELTIKQGLNDTSREEEGLLQDLIAKRDEAKRAAAAAGKEVTSQINAANKAQEDAIKVQVEANKAALDKIKQIKQANDLALIEGTEERTREELRLQNEANLASVEQLKVSEKIKQQIRDAFNDQYKIALDQLNAEIADREADAQTQLRLLQIDAQKQTINDKVALKELELKQLEIQQKRELEVFKGSDLERKVLLQQQLNERNALIKENEDLKIQIIEDTAKKEAEIRQKNADNEKAALEEERDKRIATAEQFANAINAISETLDAATEIRTAKIEADAQKEIDAINKLPIAEEEKEKRILEIQQRAQKESELLEKKNAQRQKLFAISQALINGALAITKAMVQFGPPPSPAGIAAIAAASIATATQVALIGAQKFAKGGLIPKDGGWIEGNSHANGGVKFSVGGRVMEAEGGEIIVNKGIQKRPDFVQAISEMNYLTGGKRFETGGIVAPKFSAAGVSIAAQQQQIGNITLSVPPMQVLNNVVDTTDQQSSIIQIQNQTTIGG